MENIENVSKVPEKSANESKDNFMERYEAVCRNTGIHAIDVYKMGLKLIASGKSIDGQKQISRAIDLGLKGKDLNTAYYFNASVSHQNIVRVQEKFIEVCPHSPEAYYDLAEIHLASREYDKALEKYTDALKCDPDMEEALIGRGIALSKLDKDLDALKDFHRAVQINPASEKGYFYMGRTYFKIYSFNLASKAFDKCIKINPNYADAYNWRGKTFELLRKFNDAMINYNHALDLDSNKIETYYRRGRLYQRLNQHQRAVYDFWECIDLIECVELVEARDYRGWPPKKLAYYKRGCVYMEMGDINHAIDDFNKAIRMDSNFLKARLKRAYAYFKKGYLGEAKKDLEKAESIASHGWLRP